MSPPDSGTNRLTTLFSHMKEGNGLREMERRGQNERLLHSEEQESWLTDPTNYRVEPGRYMSPQDSGKSLRVRRTVPRFMFSEGGLEESKPVVDHHVSPTNEGSYVTPPF